jgi:hypothetical protein
MTDSKVEEKYSYTTEVIILSMGQHFTGATWLQTHAVTYKVQKSGKWDIHKAKQEQLNEYEII